MSRFKRGKYSYNQPDGFVLINTELPLGDLKTEFDNLNFQKKKSEKSSERQFIFLLKREGYILENLLNFYSFALISDFRINF